jgi:hypothetical protein
MNNWVTAVIITIVIVAVVIVLWYVFRKPTPPTPPTPSIPHPVIDMATRIGSYYFHPIETNDNGIMGVRFLPIVGGAGGVGSGGGRVGMQTIAVNPSFSDAKPIGSPVTVTFVPVSDGEVRIIRPSDINVTSPEQLPRLAMEGGVLGLLWHEPTKTTRLLPVTDRRV